MKIKIAFMVGCAMLCGCVEPPCRYDIRGNGEGGVDIHKVPKEPPPAPAPPPAPVVAVPPAPSSPPPVVVPAPPAPPVRLAPAANPQEQRINDLESRVRELSAENERLKRQAATAPTTNP